MENTLKSTLGEICMDLEAESVYQISRDEDEFPYHKVILKRDKDGDNLLFVATVLDETQLAIMLINLIPSYKLLSGQNKLFQSALHLATLNDNDEIARRLIVGGIKIDLQDRKGNTALHIACKKGYFSTAKVLLTPVKYSETAINSYLIPYQKIPQNLEIRNSDGLTCFLVATLHRHKDIMKLLLENDADINAYEMKSGKTSLHMVVESEDTELLKFLTSKPKLKLDARTYSGYTPVKIAQIRCKQYIEYCLRCAGAQSDDSDSSDDGNFDI